jgi:hypothetical protein
MRGMRRFAAVLLTGFALIGASPLPAGYDMVATVDPMGVQDDDFARNRDPAIWSGLSVQRLAFSEGAAMWHLWRIANVARPDGPLWVVTHDNENATFAAALSAVRNWGGVAMVVDTDASDTQYSARFNRDVEGGWPIDPNRNFRDDRPLYVSHMLADLGPGPRLIVALHTNAPGFAPALASCSPAPLAGGGDISIKLCNDRFQPSASHRQQWPFDDEDSLALVPYLATADRGTAYCGNRLAAADFNLVFERVAKSDGSLSNYAAQHGLRYINFETRERGSDPAGIAAARDRLTYMIDNMMGKCSDMPGIQLAQFVARQEASPSPIADSAPRRRR